MNGGRELGVSYTEHQYLMISSALAACIALFGAQQSDTVDLGRVFTKGEKLTYKVRSNLHSEERGGPLKTFIPQDLDINYDFTLAVTQMKTDGIAVVNYQRPTMNIIEGETVDSPPVTHVEKTKLNFNLTVSPLNELLDMQDLSKPEGKAKLRVPVAPVKPQIQGFLGQFIGEMDRMALFVGSLDSSLDFTPKLQSTKVKVGDTWKKTFAYQPQKLKGKNGKTVVQRIDFVYVYKGKVTVNGKSFQRIEADYNLDTDLSQFINDTFGVTSDDTGLDKLPLTLKSHIEFNLDPVTRDTVSALAVTEGGYQVFVTEQTSAVYESRMKGQTSLTLASRKR